MQLTMATHPGGPLALEITNQYLRWGASPRAAQTLTLAAAGGNLSVNTNAHSISASASGLTTSSVSITNTGNLASFTVPANGGPTNPAGGTQNEFNPYTIAWYDAAQQRNSAAMTPEVTSRGGSVVYIQVPRGEWASPVASTRICHGECACWICT